MLLLKPSVVVTARLHMILVESVHSVTAKRGGFGMGLYWVPVHLPLGSPLVQHVRVVAGGGREVVLLCQLLR